MDNLVRVSCSGLSSIKIGDKFLLIQNRGRIKKFKKIVYTPIGGALHYNEKSLPILKSIKFKPVRKDPDLRFFINDTYSQKFIDWFNKREDREISNFRETHEELVLEEKVLNDLTESDISEKYIKTIKKKMKLPFYDTKSLYLFEIFKQKFPIDIEIILNHDSYSNGKVKLFTKKEIQNGLSESGDSISSHSKHILI